MDAMVGRSAWNPERPPVSPLDRALVSIRLRGQLGCSMVPLKLEGQDRVFRKYMYHDETWATLLTKRKFRIECGEGASLVHAWTRAWRFTRCRIVVAAGNRRTRASGPARRIQAQIRSQQV